MLNMNMQSNAIVQSVPIAASGLVVVYRPEHGLPDLEPYVGQTVDVIVRQQDALPGAEPRLNRQLWGTDVYTDDSDVVAALYHSGKLSAYRPENVGDLVVTIHVRSGIAVFEASLQWAVQSRRWRGHEGFSYSIAQARQVSSLRPSQRRIVNTTLTAWQIGAGAGQLPRLTTPSRDPTTAKEVAARLLMDDPLSKHVVFGQTLHTCLKYEPAHVLYTGLDGQNKSSFRLKSEILYLEGGGRRFLICAAVSHAATATQSDGIDDHDRFRFAEDVRVTAGPPIVGLPSEDRLRTLHEQVSWGAFAWDLTGVVVNHVRYPVRAMYWRPQELPPPPTSVSITSAPVTVSHGGAPDHQPPHTHLPSKLKQVTC